MVRSGVHRAGEVGVVARADAVLGAPLPPGRGRDDVRQRAHGQADVRGVAGEQVAAAGAVAGEQAAAVGVPPLDLRGVDRVGDAGDVVAVLLVPAEPEDVVVGAVQDAADGGAGLRAPVGVPGGQRVAARAQPGGQVRHRAVADGAAGGVVGERVDLQEEHAGRPLVGAVRSRAALRRARRKNSSSLSTASRLLTSPDTAAIVTPTTTADAEVGDVHARGRRRRAPAPRRPSSRKLPRPRVKNATGSATRMTSGQASALSRPSSRARTGACHHEGSVEARRASRLSTTSAPVTAAQVTTTRATVRPVRRSRPRSGAVAHDVSQCSGSDRRRPAAGAGCRPG